MLQVLLNDFELCRQGNAVRLKVRLRKGLPEVKRSRDKSGIKTAIPRFEELARHYQDRLEALSRCLTPEEVWSYHDDSFVFRYASGGVLPILEWEGARYYSLFFRDIDPIGWNIANGATETAEELADPRIAIEREFCEELVIANPSQSCVYRLECETSSLSAGREARKHWVATLAGRHARPFTEEVLRVQWINGPDSLVVDHGGRESVVGECFVNVNATDFGIELDRVALISVGSPIVVCDGELLGEKKVNRPVGLFRVEEVHQRLVENAARFQPDTLFYDGQLKDASRLDELITEEYLPSQSYYRSELEQAHFKDMASRQRQYDLCPAARNIIRRFATMDQGRR